MYYPYYGDVAKLDANHDGRPCESLPGAANTYTPRAEVVAAATIIRLQVAGHGGVPTSGVSAVVINVTAVDPTGAGYIQVAPTPVIVGASSNLNTATGRTIANLVVVPIGTGGAVDLYTTTPVDLVADVTGYFTDSTAANSTAGLFVPITPNRQLDTREPGPRTPLPSGTTTRIDINDISPDAIAVAGNLTATQAARGWVQLAAAPVPVAASSNLNLAYDDQTIANAVVSPVAGGLLEAHNSATAHVLLDVTGHTRPTRTVRLQHRHRHVVLPVRRHDLDQPWRRRHRPRCRPLRSVGLGRLRVGHSTPHQLRQRPHRPPQPDCGH